MPFHTTPIGFSALVGLVLGLFATPGAWADTATSGASATPVYRPPLLGAPARRVGGGSRGEGAEALVLQVLAPEHAGLTIAEQPTLYWFISGPAAGRLELTLIDDNAVEPLLEIQADPPEAPGIYPLPLADHGIRLIPDVTYQWFVALVTDPAQRSADVLSGGAIRRVAPPPGPAPAEAFAYADRGLWYDALNALSRQIARDPGDPHPRRQRAALLEQIGAAEAARFEREAGER